MNHAEVSLTRDVLTFLGRLHGTVCEQPLYSEQFSFCLVHLLNLNALHWYCQHVFQPPTRLRPDVVYKCGHFGTDARPGITTLSLRQKLRGGGGRKHTESQLQLSLFTFCSLGDPIREEMKETLDSP